MKEQRPVTGTPQYFELRKQAFRSIREIRQAYIAAEKSPSYTAGGYNSDGEPVGIEENTGHYDRAHRRTIAALKNPFVRETLEAHGLQVKQKNPEYDPIVLNKDGWFISSRDIPVFGETKNSK
jgi:hypothetical protein